MRLTNKIVDDGRRQDLSLNGRSDHCHPSSNNLTRQRYERPTNMLAIGRGKRQVFALAAQSWTLKRRCWASAISLANSGCVT
jgi:hypothetical protein